MLQKLTLLYASCACPLLAQNFLDPLFVTATRSEQSASATPYTVHYLDNNFLRENSRRTLPEALQYTPGVLVQKTAHGHGSPFIRGFTGRQNLLLVDGIRINNSTFRTGPVQYWNTVDSLSLDHIELIKSQGSVLYGSDAAGGTLNALTKSSNFRDRDSGQAYTGGSAYYEYRSNGQGSHIGRGETEAGVGGKFGILLGISAKEFGDIEDSAIGQMKGTGYPEQDLDLRMDWAVSPDSTVTFAHYQVNQDDISRWHRTLNNPGWIHDEHVAAPGTFLANTYDQERSLSYLRYAGENPTAGSFVKSWTMTLSYQTSQDSEYQARTASDLRRNVVDLETFGLDLGFESAVGPGSLVYGLDYYVDEISAYAKGTNLAGDFVPLPEYRAIADDSSYHLFGAYAQYEWSVNEALKVIAGGRYTRAEAEWDRYDPVGAAPEAGGGDAWNDFSANLKVVQQLSSAWNLYGGVSQAFRAPNLSDLAGNQLARSSTTILGGEADPETYLTYEIGARRQTDTTSLGVAVFHTQIDDLIVPVPTTAGSTVRISQNAGDAYVQGVETEAAWRFSPNWTLSGFAAWQEGQVESPDFENGPVSERPMTRQLPLSGSVALRWDDHSRKWWVEGRLLAAAKEDRVADDDQKADTQRLPLNGTPEYLVATLRAGWSVTENVDLTAGLENIADDDYRIHGSGQNEPGFGGILGVKVKW